MIKLFFIAICCVNLVACAWVFDPIPAKSSIGKKISPEIVNELKDFANLIPAAVIDEVVAEHFITDPDFRTAFKYVQTHDFTLLMEKLQEVPEVNEILEFLHLLIEGDYELNLRKQQQQLEEYNEYHQNIPYSDETDFFWLPQNAYDDDVEEIKRNFSKIEEIIEKGTLMDAIYASLEFVPLSLPKKSRKLYSSLEIEFNQRKVRSFTSFVEQLFRHLPHDKFANLINEKRQKSQAFAAFYSALRNEQFQPMVETAIKSSNLKDYIHKLGSHAIDVVGLKPIAFNVISWGPKP